MPVAFAEALRKYKQLNPDKEFDFRDVKAFWESLQVTPVAKRGEKVKVKPATEEQIKRAALPEKVKFHISDFFPDFLPRGEDWLITGYVDKKTETIYNNANKEIEIGEFENMYPRFDQVMLANIINGMSFTGPWEYKYPPYLEYEEITE